MVKSNKQFILDDIGNNEGDFDIEDIVNIRKGLKRIEYQKMLNENYENYDDINEFYNEVCI